MRRPAAWKDTPADLLAGTAVELADPAAPGSGVSVVKGVWPGVRMSRGGDANAGPTGVAWVDSNGWLARLTSALHPGNAVWIDAPPPANTRLAAGSYLVAMADAAASGARWIVSLDDTLAAGMAARKPEALSAWKTIAAAARFFADRREWAGWAPEAVVGVVSDFTGKNEFLGQELLNLLDRAGEHYRILLKHHLPADPFAGLRAVLYADQEPPPDALRKAILAYVEAGGLLIATPTWGEAPGKPAAGETHPRFSFKILGKGRIAIAAQPDDPYVLANDTVVLVSHRYDIVRCWNSGAFASFYAVAPGRRKAVVHLLYYANRGPDAASVRVTGPWRSAAFSTVEQPAARPAKLEIQKDAVEVYLPQVSQYVALELEA
jgi:hypothetical protein